MQLSLTDGMRKPVSERDAVRSQVIDVLKAQIKRRPAMKKNSTAAAKTTRKVSQQKLTIGLDLGDRSSWYCLARRSGGSASGTETGHDSEGDATGRRMTANAEVFHRTL